MPMSQQTQKYGFIEYFCQDDFVQRISIDIPENELKMMALQSNCAATIFMPFW